MKLTNQNVNDVGLSVFQQIKKWQGNQVNIDELSSTGSVAINHDQWHQLLQKHVASNGSVNYSGFKTDQEQLEDYLELLSNFPANASWSEPQQIAYWINAYNAFTIKLIIDHYPVASIKDIGGNITMVNSPWDIKFFKIGGVDFDLNTIEHQILRKEFEEPRIHFAVNCASISCPALLNEAYTAEELNRQLEQQAKFFINDTDKNGINPDAIEISKIFDWFKSDFTKETTLVEFINPYTDTDLSAATKVSYMKYDWNLNGQ